MERKMNNQPNKTSSMKRYSFLLYTTLLMLLLPLPCFSQGIVTMDITSFKEENDSLVVNYKIWVPAETVVPGQGLRIFPVVQTKDSVLFLPRMTVLGKNKHKVLSRYHNNSELGYPPCSVEAGDIPLIYKMRVPYQQWMDSARLCIRQEVSGYRGSKLVTLYKMSDRVDLAPRIPYHVNPQLAFMTPLKEEKRRRRQGKAYLDFQVGRSVVIPTYRRNPEELLKIDDAVKDVVNNRDASLQGLYIEGFASPEGSYTLNERLSKERATALKDYIKSKFSLDEGLFKVSSVPEDWGGLEALVQASELNNKEKLLEVITSTDAPDKKEVTIKSLNKGASYRIMLKEMFPELRRVEYQIDYTVKDYGLEETKALIGQNIENLSQLELYHLALSYEKGSKQYKDILMETIPRQFSEDQTASNNAAAILLENGELATASRYLDKAGDSPAAINNRGILFLLEGELDKAAECFNRAAKAGIKEAVHNLKEVQIKREDNKKMKRFE